jgi:hypothetical protein
LWNRRSGRRNVEFHPDNRLVTHRPDSQPVTRHLNGHPVTHLFAYPLAYQLVVRNPEPITV